jgi:hypothetical protein
MSEENTNPNFLHAVPKRIGRPPATPLIPGETQQERTKRLRRLAQQRRREAQSEPVRQTRRRQDNQAHLQRLQENRDAVASQRFACSYTLDEFKFPLNFPLDSNVGQMNIQCSHCEALRFPGETQTICCGNGTIQLDLPKPPEGELWDLFAGNHPNSRFFKENIRSFNQALSFASFVASQDELPSGGPPTFRVHGQVYHNLGPLLTSEAQETPKFMQIYFHDTADSTQVRLNATNLNSPGPASEIMQLLENEVRRCSPYIQRFEYAIQRMLETPSLLLVLQAEKRPPTGHARVYNVPTADEVAVLIPESYDENTKPSARDFVVHLRGGGVKRMKVLNQHYDPLHYVLLYIFGEEGWNMETRSKEQRRKKISVMDFYAFYLMVRPTPTALHYAGRLLQQWCVDMYAKMELQRLDYFRFHQKDIRADHYYGVEDSIAQNDSDVAGKRIILPSSFTGGPRYMAQCFQDAMSVVREFGKPDLFITFTCNPSWIEITSNMLPNQASNERADLISRVFQLKLKMLIKDLKSGAAFGPLAAHIFVVEFQKRGLPHAHILVILETKIIPDHFDKYVSAEIPCSSTQKDLFDLVTKHMVHKCSTDRCLDENGNCSKRFPKDYSSETTISEEDGYPRYRRLSPSEGGNVAEIECIFFRFPVYILTML